MASLRLRYLSARMLSVEEAMALKSRQDFAGRAQAYDIDADAFGRHLMD
jgi:hypothetical protein